jgi:hypothetical protein
MNGKVIRTAIAMNIENTDFVLVMVSPLLSAGSSRLLLLTNHLLLLFGTFMKP